MSALLLFSALAFAQETASTESPILEPVPIPDTSAASMSQPVDALPSTTDAPRLVEQITVDVEAEAPTRRASRLRAAIESAGGTLARYQEEHDSEWGDSVYLEAWGPVQTWPAVEASLSLGPDDSLDREVIPRSDQMGQGSPHVELAIEISAPTPAEPNFLVGMTGSVLIPADTSGPGLAQLYTMRVMNPDREGSLEVAYGTSDPFFRQQDAPWMLQITGGSSMYSDFLGGGERSVFNPFIGGRLGYAYRGESWFVLQGEVGVEILHLNHFILDVHARPTGHFRKGAVGLSVETGAGLVFPF